jgi:hypothetical protein
MLSQTEIEESLTSPSSVSEEAYDVGIDADTACYQEVDGKLNDLIAITLVV